MNDKTTSLTGMTLPGRKSNIIPEPHQDLKTSLVGALIRAEDISVVHHRAKQQFAGEVVVIPLVDHVGVILIVYPTVTNLLTVDPSGAYLEEIIEPDQVEVIKRFRSKELGIYPRHETVAELIDDFNQPPSVMDCYVTLDDHVRGMFLPSRDCTVKLYPIGTQLTYIVVTQDVGKRSHLIHFDKTTGEVEELILSPQDIRAIKNKSASWLKELGSMLKEVVAVWFKGMLFNQEHVADVLNDLNQQLKVDDSHLPLVDVKLVTGQCVVTSATPIDGVWFGVYISEDDPQSVYDLCAIPKVQLLLLRWLTESTATVQPGRSKVDGSLEGLLEYFELTCLFHKDDPALERLRQDGIHVETIPVVDNKYVALSLTKGTTNEFCLLDRKGDIAYPLKQLPSTFDEFKEALLPWTVDQITGKRVLDDLSDLHTTPRRRPVVDEEPEWDHRTTFELISLTAGVLAKVSAEQYSSRTAREARRFLRELSKIASL